ncbi:MAG: tryptophan--tRNA ligase, partial [Planctomycetes bacterium]|nr:tryptophan--tRNA ligase [Planctomycetota bacterium]
MTVVLSGIQSSGRLHFGNYFGAIRQHIALQEEPGEHFYFIADYHALTSSRDPAELRDNACEVALTYLALGLDPARATLFRQSDVPEVCELAWLLACVAPMGLLERAHSYKDKLAKGQKASVGLFTYPVLMAADILAYGSTEVPVGKDQQQHVEMTQDMAQSFNHLYGPCLVVPKPRIPAEEHLAKVPGVDGEKMSKTYGNSIWIFEEGKLLRNAVNRIVTDSRPPEEPKDPEGVLLLRFLALFLTAAELAEWSQRVRSGGPTAPGYGHLKARLIEAIDATFGPARARRAEGSVD